MLMAEEAASGVMAASRSGRISNGGLDANWFSARGIPTVTLGCGQVNPTRPQSGSACRSSIGRCGSRSGLRSARRVENPSGGRHVDAGHDLG